MQRQPIKLLLPIIAVAAVFMVGGCNEQKKPANTTTSNTPSCGTVESYDCNALDNDNPLKQSWCEAKQLFSQKEEFKAHLGDAEQFSKYVKGYRQGINDARQAKASRITRLGIKDHDKVEDSGYRDGYNTLATQLGMMMLSGEDENMPSDYNDLRKEAINAYRADELNGGDNPFLQDRYIAGYMVGGRTAMMTPAPMDALLNGNMPQAETITIPEGDLPEIQVAFYKGFNNGYKTMLASLQESIKQAMEQMQMSDNMMPPAR